MLSKQLMVEFGWGFHAKNLARKVQFAEFFQTPTLSLRRRDEKIVSTLSPQLNWSHFGIRLRTELRRGTMETRRRRLARDPSSLFRRAMPDRMPDKMPDRRTSSVARNELWRTGCPTFRRLGGSLPLPCDED
jgi:hypothetical protein